MLGALIGACWFGLAVAKAASLMFPSDPPVAGLYPSTLLWVAVAVEIVLASLVFLRNAAVLATTGVLVLGVFTLVIVLWPPSKSGCGCLGIAESTWLGRIDPVVRNSAFASAHVLLASLSCRPRERRASNRAA
jgi:hypothetical protein